jgi:hypothetical protein
VFFFRKRIELGQMIGDGFGGEVGEVIPQRIDRTAAMRSTQVEGASQPMMCRPPPPASLITLG